MSKISVCVPVYKVEQYIARCLDSIQNQSLKDIEIIVVNDCSPDNSMKIVKRFAAMDSRIKIIEHDANHGLMVARRTGYIAASGDYITFCDSDDTLPPQALEELYKKAEEDKADIVSGCIEYVPVDGKRYNKINKLSYGTDRISVFHSLLTDEFGHNLCSRLFRRDLLQNHDYETFEKSTNGEDGILFYQVVDNTSKVVTTDYVVYEYWQNVDSSSNTKLNGNALKSIARLNRIRRNTAGKYESLTNLVDRKLSLVWWNLKSQGYEVEKYFKSEGLHNYGGVLKGIHLNGFIGLMKIMIKIVVNKTR